ncbi:MAG: hypothetical protein Crog4KO_28980 [Crocinitomicaceae bacterium]
MRNKNWIILILFGVIFLLSSSFSTTPDNTATLTVEITNIKNTDGVVQIGLYKKPENFPSPNKQYRVERIKPSGKTLTYKFTGLAPGKYAVAIYHDENGDKKCNRNLIGVPTEAYAFSQNFRPGLSAPKFSDCCVTVKKTKVVSIKLVY